MIELNDSSTRSPPGCDARSDDVRPSARRRQRERALAEARLYVCTDARAERGDLESFLHSAYAGGADVIQLRDKSLEVDRELEALRLLARIAAEHGRLFAVNDRADLAAVVGADVYHSGQHDLTPDDARLVIGPDMLIGRSTRTIDQAQTALTDPEVDYFCAGPVWETPTKPGRPAVGLDHLRRVAGQAGRAGEGKPWFAIGGIDRHRLPEVVAAGARRVVVVRAVTEADDVEAAAASLRAAVPAATV